MLITWQNGQKWINIKEPEIMIIRECNKIMLLNPPRQCSQYSSLHCLASITVLRLGLLTAWTLPETHIILSFVSIVFIDFILAISSRIPVVITALFILSVLFWVRYLLLSLVELARLEVNFLGVLLFSVCGISGHVSFILAARLLHCCHLIISLIFGYRQIVSFLALTNLEYLLNFLGIYLSGLIRIDIPIILYHPILEPTKQELL